MTTINQLKLEISRLKERLNKAVIFELTPGTVIGLSEEDDLWRIRRELGKTGAMFLNKNSIWEEAPIKEDTSFAARTGFDTSDEALEVYEKYSLEYASFDSHEQTMIDMFRASKNILKNN